MEQIKLSPYQKIFKKIFCVMQNRYSPPARWMKEITSSGYSVIFILFKSIVFGIETKDI